MFTAVTEKDQQSIANERENDEVSQYSAKSKSDTIHQKGSTCKCAHIVSWYIRYSFGFHHNKNWWETPVKKIVA